jgi:undecaprenol kinase
MKNKRFDKRMGFAVAGIVWVWRNEESFRTECAIAGCSVLVTALLQPGWIWAALVGLAIALVLAFELMNSALECALDRLHPDIAPEIKHAKDAASGAVLTASAGALAVGVIMLLVRWAS